MPSLAVAQPNSVEWDAEKLGCSVLPPAYPARSPIALDIFNRQQLRSFPSFLCSLDQDIYADIASTYRPKGYAVISTGHSLGGALASYVAHIFSGAAITFRSARRSIGFETPRHSIQTRFTRSIWRHGRHYILRHLYGMN